MLLTARVCKSRFPDCKKRFIDISLLIINAKPLTQRNRENKLLVGPSEGMVGVWRQWLGVCILILFVSWQTNVQLKIWKSFVSKLLKFCGSIPTNNQDFLSPKFVFVAS